MSYLQVESPEDDSEPFSRIPRDTNLYVIFALILFDEVAQNEQQLNKYVPGRRKLLRRYHILSTDGGKADKIFKGGGERNVRVAVVSGYSVVDFDAIEHASELVWTLCLCSHLSTGRQFRSLK